MSLLKLLKPLGASFSYLNFKVDRLRLATLIGRGLKIGRNCYIMEGVEFDLGYPFLIEVGDNCRISKGVRVLAHDATAFRDLGVTRIEPVKILKGTFIGERAIILPGVTIGPRAIIAAGSVVNRDIGPNLVAGGNPARPYGKYSDLVMRSRERLTEASVVKNEDIALGKVTKDALVGFLKEKPFAFVRGMPRKDPYYVNTDYEAMRAHIEHLYELATSEPSSPESDQSRSPERSTRGANTEDVPGPLK